jgi:hypothetical protein
LRSAQQLVLVLLLLLQVVYFKTNRKFIHEYPNLRGYVQVRQQALSGQAARAHYYARLHQATTL